jgi:hypothetical protein
MNAPRDDRELERDFEHRAQRPYAIPLRTGHLNRLFGRISWEQSNIMPHQIVADTSGVFKSQLFSFLKSIVSETACNTPICVPRDRRRSPNNAHADDNIVRTQAGRRRSLSIARFGDLAARKGSGRRLPRGNATGWLSGLVDSPTEPSTRSSKLLEEAKSESFSSSMVAWRKGKRAPNLLRPIGQSDCG